MQAAQALAGYTLGGADLLRRAMGKKKVEEMARQRETFVQGAARVNHIPGPRANQIFDLLEKFAGYGFNKSHAAAYAMVAYQTAYLKANYPVEFYCAMMTNDMGDTEKLSQYIEEARSLGLEVLGPDINESEVHFTPVRAGRRGGAGNDAGPADSPRAIRFGLAAIKGVGEAAVQTLLKARGEFGGFKSLADMCERVDGRALNRKILEALIKSGACDGFGKARAALAAQIDRTLARAAGVIADRLRGQTSLFDGLEDSATGGVEAAADLPEWPEHELLAQEKELLGFYVTGHPLTPYASLLRQYSLTTTKGIAALPNRSLTRLGGMVGAVQKGISKRSGKAYALVTLEDLEGSVQLLCVNESFEKFVRLLEVKSMLMVIGEVNTGDEQPKIFPQEILPLDDAPRRFTKQVHLRLNLARLTPDLLTQTRELAAAHRGQCPLYLCFAHPGGEHLFIEAHERYRVDPTRAFQAAVEALLGPGAYYAKIDTALPERAPRRWERRGGTENDEPAGGER